MKRAAERPASHARYGAGRHVRARGAAGAGSDEEAEVRALAVDGVHSATKFVPDLRLDVQGFIDELVARASRVGDLRGAAVAYFAQRGAPPSGEALGGGGGGGGGVASGAGIEGSGAATGVAAAGGGGGDSGGSEPSVPVAAALVVAAPVGSEPPRERERGFSDQSELARLVDVELRAAVAVMGNLATMLALKACALARCAGGLTLSFLCESARVRV
jgi:hypothetical protein